RPQRRRTPLGLIRLARPRTQRLTPSSARASASFACFLVSLPPPELARATPAPNRKIAAASQATRRAKRLVETWAIQAHRPADGSVQRPFRTWTYVHVG